MFLSTVLLMLKNLYSKVIMVVDGYLFKLKLKQLVLKHGTAKNIPEDEVADSFGGVSDTTGRVIKISAAIYNYCELFQLRIENSRGAALISGWTNAELEVVKHQTSVDTLIAQAKTGSDVLMWLVMHNDITQRKIDFLSASPVKRKRLIELNETIIAE